MSQPHVKYVWDASTRGIVRMLGFDKILGHEQIKEHFQNAVQKRKVSHAYILSGEAGMGRKSLANAFASLKRKKLISTTPLNDALNALILALNASAAAFVLLFTKKFRILS